MAATRRIDVFQALLERADGEPVRRSARDAGSRPSRATFETGWRKALHDGWIADTAYAESARRHTPRSTRSKAQVPTPAPKDSIEIIFRPDPNVYDGRWNNVGWLQELPKPVTNLSWDNAAIVSGATLTKWGYEEDDIIEIHRGQRTGQGAGHRCARSS